MYNGIDTGSRNWTSDIRESLYTYGFGYIWEIIFVLRFYRACAALSTNTSWLKKGENYNIHSSYPEGLRTSSVYNYCITNA